MDIDIEAFKKITTGVEFIEEKDGLITFHRFTKEQEKYYEDYYLFNPREYKGGYDMLHPREYYSAGVCVSFITDSKKLLIDVFTEEKLTKYFVIDILVNGSLYDSIKNVEKEELLTYDGKTRLCKYKGVFGEYIKEIDLGVGEKEVKIVFPWSTITKVKQIQLDDNSKIKPIRRNKKYIAYGDSITYGANSFHPSNHYTYRLAEFFNAELYNKGIGAEKFCPELLKKEEPIEPDYVTVAYGTNEDGAESMEEFQKRCHLFLEILSKKFTKAKIYVISPIYRSDCEDEGYYTEFKKKERFILETAKSYKNLIVLYGYDLVEQSQDYFSDRPLHPNDKGFDSFAKNLIKKIEKA